jgi:hypothetical protein
LHFAGAQELMHRYVPCLALVLCCIVCCYDVASRTATKSGRHRSSLGSFGLKRCF